MPPADQLWDMDSDSDCEELDYLPCTAESELKDDSTFQDLTATQYSCPQEQSWHRDYHFPYREQMVQTMVQLIRELHNDQTGPPASNWEEKLPLMVEQLELVLYCSAPTFEAYIDEQTIKSRLQNVAFEMADERDAEDCDTLDLDEQFDGITLND